MTAQRQPVRGRQRAKRGQIMVLFALTITVFMGALLLGVDLSRLRTEAENMQRAANAAALAGVVFLPTYPDSAKARALVEATKNGFTTGVHGVTVTPSQSSTNNNQMQVTISEPISLFFGPVFGLGSKTLSRTATAEFNQPLEMGAPDYVLGYAGYPTNLAGASGGTQNFYLIARGPYGQQENGDAYSQYYEGYSGQVFHPSGGNTYDQNPCNSTNFPGSPVLPGGCDNLTYNPDLTHIGQSNGFSGYDFVVDNPTNQTLIIKIFDPYDEGLWSAKASNGPTGSKLIDQIGSCSGNVNFCPSIAGVTQKGVPVALHFTISGPYLSPYDMSDKTITTLPTYPSSAPAVGTCTSDCVLASPFVAGNDPFDEYCRAQSTATSWSNPVSAQQTCYQTKTSDYAFKFLNYAIITQKGLYHIKVQSGLNTYGVASNMYGTAGNVFGLAACGVNNGDGVPGHQAVLGRPSMMLTDPDAPAADGAASSDPPSTSGWNTSTSSCLNPNASLSGCSNPGLVPPDGCVHIYALHRMAIINELSSAKSLIPLGYVPPEYDGKTLVVNLYDVGDMSNSAYIRILTPAGDATNSTGCVTGYPASPVLSCNSGPAYPTNLPFTYSAAATDSSGSGYASQPSGEGVYTRAMDSSIEATDSSGFHPYNGEWLNIQIPMINWPGGKTYANMVSQYGGYWKVFYNVGGSGDDTTTWEISVAGAPVHLVDPQGS